jgi:hypothetical protein
MNWFLLAGSKGSRQRGLKTPKYKRKRSSTDLMRLVTQSQGLRLIIPPLQ